MSGNEKQNDYLWDRSGAVDSEIAELEELLGTLRFDQPMPAVDPPVARPKPSKLWWIAVAAGFALVVWGWLAREGAVVAPPVARMNIPSVDVSAASQPSAPSTQPKRGPSWKVTMLSGAPTCDGAPVDEQARLFVGDWLETDASSRAQVEVADIGTVDLEPSSRLRLVESGDNQHRVELQKGLMHAIVDAPPRVFLVDTPKLTAVDLGCEYQLEVGEDGSTWLRVSLGWVSLETKQVVSVVPAGAMCRADATGTPGLPLRRTASEGYVEAAARFAAGDSGALAALIGDAKAGDEVTLFHLLTRAPAADRRAVYDKLAGIAAPAIDRDAVLRGDKRALDAWGQTLGVLPPPGWPEEGPPDPPAPVWQPQEGGVWTAPSSKGAASGTPGKRPDDGAGTRKGKLPGKRPGKRTGKRTGKQ